MAIVSLRFLTILRGSRRGLELETPLVILMSMAGLLYRLCVCGPAPLTAGRGRARSMRYALGARRSRIVSQLLVEGGLLGIFGAAVGLFLRASLSPTRCCACCLTRNPGASRDLSSLDAQDSALFGDFHPG